MENIKQLHTQKTIENTKVNRNTISLVLEYKNIMVWGIVIMIAFAFNLFSYQAIAQVSTTNYVLENELKRVVEENSILEGIKAEALNMREIQNKALDLGFVYNNNVDYIK